MSKHSKHANRSYACKQTHTHVCVCVCIPYVHPDWNWKMGPSPPEPGYQWPSFLTASLSKWCTQTNIHLHTHTHTHACSEAQSTAPRVVGCNWTLHLYVHHVHWQRRSDKENKHAHMHAQTHTGTHKKSSDMHWSPAIDQNSFLSAFPSESIAPLVDRQP